MKKMLLISVLLMAALVINAQRTPVKITDLKKSVTDYITKDYAGFVIKDATKVISNGVETCEVGIAKGTTTETLVFDKDGKFLHKLAMKTGTPEKAGTTQPASKPATKKN